MSKPLRMIFMGTPDFAVPALRAVLDAGHDVLAVYTRAPKPKGRGGVVQKSPVHDTADAHNIPVYTPLSFRKSVEAENEFISLNADVAVVAAYGLILTPRVLAAPKFGCLNIHASLLPRWRGASPIHRAIWAGDADTGVTIMQMDAGLDTGGMICADQVPIARHTTPMMTDMLAKIGARLIVRTLDDLVLNGHVHATPQPDAGVTLAPMLTRDDGWIDWAQTATAIDAQVRALDPWPGTFTHTPAGDVIKILSAAPVAQSSSAQPGTVIGRMGQVVCGDGTVLHVTQIQTPTGKKMDIASAINGGLIAIGDIFK
jgi:methionyl-tRNA formyltransferase